MKADAFDNSHKPSYDKSLLGEACRSIFRREEGLRELTVDRQPLVMSLPSSKATDFFSRSTESERGPSSSQSSPQATRTIQVKTTGKRVLDEENHAPIFPDMPKNPGCLVPDIAAYASLYKRHSSGPHQSAHYEDARISDTKCRLTVIHNTQGKARPEQRLGHSLRPGANVPWARGNDAPKGSSLYNPSST